MKAAFYMFLFALLGIQISCASTQGPTTEPVAKAAGGSGASNLETPEVAVMPMKHAVLVAWRPIADADGYFVYRETQDPPAKKMLGIGPKNAQGFLDREPAAAPAQYSVQAFKVSDISDKKESKGLSAGPTTVPSEVQLKPRGRAMQVADYVD